MNNFKICIGNSTNSIYVEQAPDLEPLQGLEGLGGDDGWIDAGGWGLLPDAIGHLWQRAAPEVGADIRW